MPFLTLLLLGAILVLGAISAFFSAAETAMFALRGPQIETVKASRPRDAELIAGFLARPRQLLGMLVLGDVAANVPLCLLCLLLLEEQIPRLLMIEVPRWAAAPILFAIIIGACDLVPKMLALKRPLPIASFAVGVLHFLKPVLAPLGDALERLSERLSERFTPNRWTDAAPLTAEEFETMAQLAAESGTLRGSEGPIVAEILRLGNKTVKDVMTPRVDAFAIPDDLGPDEAVARLRRAGRRFVPVYGDTPDDVLGVLDAREFLLHPEGDPYVERVLPPSFIPETMGALNLLQSFLNRKQGLALVVDEFGGYEGVVTPADLLEEVLQEAMPGGEEPLKIVDEADGTIKASGQARLDDLSERLGTELAQEGIDTLSGLIVHRLGHVPRAGAELALEAGWRVRVERSSRRRVEAVRIEKEALL